MQHPPAPHNIGSEMNYSLAVNFLPYLPAIDASMRADVLPPLHSPEINSNGMHEHGKKPVCTMIDDAYRLSRKADKTWRSNQAVSLCISPQ
jgi:hypothetical protein